jgi:streptogramin lyase
MKIKGTVVVAYLIIVLTVIGVILYYVFTFNLFAPASMAHQTTVKHKQVGGGKTEEIHQVPSTKVLQAATTSSPWGLALDSMRHIVWVAEPGCEPRPTCLTKKPGILGQYNQFDGRWIQDFPEPSGYTRPTFIALAEDGTVWFTEPDSDAIGELDPQSLNWNQWTMSAGSAPFDLTFDTRGDLWFTEFNGNAIGFFNPHTDTSVVNQIPTPDSNPYGITMDSRGTIWFTENRSGVGQIGSFTPTASGKITIVEHKVTSAQPHLITTDRHGNIWYSEAFGGSIGEYTPVSGRSVDYPVSVGACANVAVCITHISGISVDPEGDIWYSDTQLFLVGYLVPSTGKVVTKTISNQHEGGSNLDDSAYDGLAVDEYNSVWFTEPYSALLVMWPKKTVK